MRSQEREREERRRRESDLEADHATPHQLLVGGLIEPRRHLLALVNVGEAIALGQPVAN